MCIRGGRGAEDPPPFPPRISQIAIFGPKIIIIGQNHLIFGQAMNKRFGQPTSAP